MRARATVNDDTLPRLKVQIIAGGANNQLAEDRHGDELERREILYAPDYVINGGGVINVYGELNRWPAERSLKKAGEIYDTLLRIFEIARTERIPTYRAADRLAAAADRRRGRAGPDVDGRAALAAAGCPLYCASEFLYIRDQMPEVIPIGADHAGFELKQRLVEELRTLGYEPLDLGTDVRNRPTIPTTRTRSRPGWSTTTPSAACCSAAPASACRTRPTAIPGCAPRSPGRRRSRGSRASTTTPTFSFFPRGS